MKRQVFFSFNYDEDHWRASQIINIGIVQINKQIQACECMVVLVGQNTANKQQINNDIIQSWEKEIGIVGIYVHGLIDHHGLLSERGENPFDYINIGEHHKLSEVVKCYNPSGISSRLRHNWISRHLSDVVEEAIWIRNRYK